MLIYGANYMLIPLTRQTFHELVPAVATSEQYQHCWGKPSQFIRRLLVSAVGTLILALVELSVQFEGRQILLIPLVMFALYWLWGPIWDASIRNRQFRKYPYCGFWQGKVLDYYISEAVTNEQESVNSKGDLIIIENLERRINVEVGDKTGFVVKIEAPLNRNHKRLSRGQVAVMLVTSYLDDLSSINEVSDVYIPSQNIWVGSYPYLRRDMFMEITREMRSRYGRPKSRSPRRSPSPRQQAYD
ncbi:phosphate ABC transporter permease [Limnospira fusiformis KN01]|uniref:phosphate ABC transporter permease n=2 Tax=Sirenicapillariaceae TaxID=2934961 RepID=UPI0016588F6A|nr:MULTISPECIES: phosphate ABC transporter permease [Limnospira]MDT9177208.1 phosphate ABC transporter permease [Limnospira sp. PMC 1238.20]MDT9233058.1 phosphate ABC transporter permease [Limnospira sp. PMC 917.15]MDY7052924.1 phosphate ABC transporter permease [Limnospira fusiformis LS22]ULB44612.1 phosphate ABC transporter permease [Limnospira fusiformis KN01]